MDLGLVATTTWNRVFGALKSAVDGGLNIPLNAKRFLGSKNNAEKDITLDSAVHRERTFSVHFDKYMKNL